MNSSLHMTFRPAGRAVHWALTLTIAVAFGIVLALALTPRWQQQRALSGITAASADRRAAAWQWLNRPIGDAHQTPRAVGLLDSHIVPRLETAQDDAVLDAGVALRKVDLWTWSRIPAPLLLRELSLRADTGDVDQHRVTIELMERVPLDAPADSVVPIFSALLRSESDSVQQRAFEAGWMWSGPDHADLIAPLITKLHNERLHSLNTIALGWAARLTGQPQWVGDLSVEHTAQLLAHALAHPDDAQPLHEYIAEHDDQAAAVAAEVARLLNDSAARPVLEQLAGRDTATARFALQAMDTARDQQAARDMLEEPTAERWRRRLAAWRLPSVSRDQLNDLLYIEQTDPPQPVYQIALLAERHYRRDELATLAQRWITSLNDDEKRAGLLLHELGSEVDAEARRAAGAVFSAAAMARQTTDFDPDRVLMRLAAGAKDALRHLTSQPPAGGDQSGIIARAWLIERFVPFWHEQLGRPVGGSRAALALHFDALEALRLVTQRRLQFNAQRRAFDYQPASTRLSPPPPEREP